MGDDERRLWLVQAVALAAVAVGVTLTEIRVRRARLSVARIVARLDESVGRERLRETLASALGTTDLDVVYPLDDGRLVDADGQPVDLPPAGRAATPLVRGDRTVAVLVHRPGLLDNPVVVEEIARAAHLALDNERLRAELHAREIALQASRARIVEAGDAERRRLERNLHDGAQQRLVGLLLGTRLAQAQFAAAASTSTQTCLDRMAEDLQSTINELRDIAVGIHPAVLTDEGLGPAIDCLADTAPLDVGAMPDGRFAAAVENAAYRVIAEATRTGPTHVAGRCGNTLVVDVVAASRPDDLLDLEDRIGAVSGTLVVDEVDARGVKLHVELPMRVVIADDSMLLREGLARLLNEIGFDVVAKVATATELLAHLNSGQLDAVIVDIRMPPTHTDEGIVAAQTIRRDHPSVGVLVLSQYLAPDYAVRLLEEVPDGVGYLLKERVSDIAVLADALHRINDGECVIDPTIVSRLVKRRREHTPLESLTERERSVLTMMAEGRTNKAIGEQLFLSPKTVENHIGQIFQKLGLEPCANDHRRVLAVLAHLRAAGRGGLRVTGPRLLLVDDHAAFRSRARALLEASGFVVVGEASSGEAAISAARELQPEVVLLDVVLPDVDGFTVCKWLAEQDEPPAVVLTSSRAATTYRLQLRDSPARGFIAKDDLTGATLTALLG